MKRIFIAFCALALTTAVTAQTNTAVNTTTQVKQKKADELVKFTESRYDFGKIRQGVPVTHEFTFENIGNQPIVIETATASCGCTTPTWPKTPVVKSKKDKISAGFNAAAPGPFDKVISVKVAGYDQPVELHISGEVLSLDDYAKYEATKGKKTGTN
ncbi:MAG: DUF1573 domain-containing protein [Chitinophagaceae bacterium]